jgi:hypothetical protein
VQEPEVVRRVHKHLRQHGILGAPVARLFTDPHPTLLGLSELKPFQRFGVGWGNGVVHPDLLGQHVDGDSLLAIEAKGLGANLLTGLGQAEVYQRGVQRSFLAAPTAMLHADVVEQAKARGIGLLGVAEQVHEIYVPPERRPFNSEYRALRADIGDAAWVSESGTFSFNVPTHYLVWLIALDGAEEISLAEALQRLVGYAIPKDWRAAMRGAQKLQLMRVSPNGCQLTEFGLALRRLLPSSIQEWTGIHQRLTEKRNLVDECPPAATGLRLMLLMDPVVRLVLEALRGMSAEGVDFRALARRCGEIDSRRSAIFFLKPESAANWLSPAGSVPWELVPGTDFRSTTFYQYKSVLKHAGLLAPTRLGAASARDYDPSKDVWRLRA